MERVIVAGAAGRDESCSITDQIRHERLRASWVGRDVVDPRSERRSAGGRCRRDVLAVDQTS